MHSGRHLPHSLWKPDANAQSSLLLASAFSGVSSTEFTHQVNRVPSHPDVARAVAAEEAHLPCSTYFNMSEARSTGTSPQVLHSRAGMMHHMSRYTNAISGRRGAAVAHLVRQHRTIRFLAEVDKKVLRRRGARLRPPCRSGRHTCQHVRNRRRVAATRAPRRWRGRPCRCRR